MKKSILLTITLAVTFLFSSNAIFAQDNTGKMDKMKGEKSMEEMHKSPQHLMMTAYKHNLLAFTKSLVEIAKAGDAMDRSFAKTAVSEIRRSSDKMKMIHQDHMSKMKPEMMAEMAEMKGKMEAQEAKLSEHISALESLTSAEKSDSKAIVTHAEAIISEFDKMKDKDKMEHKDKMKDKDSLKHKMN